MLTKIWPRTAPKHEIPKLKQSSAESTKEEINVNVPKKPHAEGVDGKSGVIIEGNETRRNVDISHLKGRSAEGERESKVKHVPIGFSLPFSSMSIARSLSENTAPAPSVSSASTEETETASMALSPFSANLASAS